MKNAEACQAVNSDQETLEKFRSYLYLLTRAHLGRRERHEIEASDLVQQTMLDAHAGKSRFRGTTDAQRAAWLRQILSRNLADAMRHRHRAKRDVSREVSLDGAIAESFARADSWLADRQPSPSQRITTNEDLLRLADALTELPDAQRDAVILRHLQGRSLAHIAQELGRSESAAAGLIYRGLNRLHELLDDKSMK